jgi:hypothetical protein
MSVPPGVAQEGSSAVCNPASITNYALLFSSPVCPHQAGQHWQRVQQNNLPGAAQPMPLATAALFQLQFMELFSWREFHARLPWVVSLYLRLAACFCE